MNRFRFSCAAAILISLVTSTANAAEFEEFESAAGRFKVQMPGTPKEVPKVINGAKLTFYPVERDNWAFVVMFSDPPIPASGESEEQLQKRLDGSRNGMLRSLNATLTKETKVTLSGKYPGREIQADLPDKTAVIRARNYLVEGRIYQLMVVGPPNVVSSPDAVKFLESLTLTK